MRSSTVFASKSRNQFWLSVVLLIAAAVVAPSCSPQHGIGIAVVKPGSTTVPIPTRYQLRYVEPLHIGDGLFHIAFEVADHELIGFAGEMATSNGAIMEFYAGTTMITSARVYDALPPRGLMAPMSGRGWSKVEARKIIKSMELP